MRGGLSNGMKTGDSTANMAEQQKEYIACEWMPTVPMGNGCPARPDNRHVHNSTITIGRGAAAKITTVTDKVADVEARIRTICSTMHKDAPAARYKQGYQ